MKVQIKKSVFLRELSTAKGFNAEAVHLKANEENLELVTTSKDLVFHKQLELESVGEEDMVTDYVVEETGNVILPAQFVDILKTFPEDVIISVIDGVIHLENEDIKAHLASVKKEFPSLPEFTKGKAIKAPKELFSTIFEKVGKSVATSDSRPPLKGLYMNGENGVFTVVATDSHRLSRLQYPQNIEMPGIILPAIGFNKALSAFNDEDQVELYEGGSWALLQQENTHVYVRLIDGNYPDVSKLAEVHQNATEITVGFKDVIDAISRTVPFKSEKKVSAFSLQIKGDNAVTIESFHGEGKISSSIEATIKQGEQPFNEKIVLNSGYVLDAIRAHKADKIRFVLINDSRPVFILSEDKGNVQLALPIRTK